MKAIILLLGIMLILTGCENGYKNSYKAGFYTGMTYAIEARHEAKYIEKWLIYLEANYEDFLEWKAEEHIKGLRN